MTVSEIFHCKKKTKIVRHFLYTVYFKILTVEPRRDTGPEINKRITSSAANKAFECIGALTWILHLLRSKYTELCSQNCCNNRIRREDEAVF